MHKLKFFLLMIFLAQFACISTNNPATSLASVESTETKSVSAIPSVTASVVPVSIPSATVTLQPTLPPPPVIAPESFGEAKVLHEYWPVIREAAGLWETALFGLTVSAWAYSPDGRYLAVAGCDAEAASGYVYGLNYVNCAVTNQETVGHAYLFILDAKTESIIATLPETGQVITVTQLIFTHDGNKLIYGLDSGRIALWDIASGQIQTVITEETTSPEYFGISPDDKWIAVASEFLTRIWDLAQEKFIIQLNAPAAQFSEDGQRLLFADSSNLSLGAYETNTWQKVSERIIYPDGIENIYDISPDLSLMAMCDNRLTDTPRPMKIWNIATGELLETLEENKWGRCARFVFSPDGQLLLRFDNHGAGPLIWKVEGWKFVKGTDRKTNFVSSGDLYVNSMQFSQDGRSVMVDTVKRLTLYDLPLPSITSTPGSPATVASPAVDIPPVPTLVVKVKSCDVTVTGWLKLQVDLCLPPSRSNAGSIMSGFAGSLQSISLIDSEFTQVRFEIPEFMQDDLKPGTYTLGNGDASGNDGKIAAVFYYYDHKLGHSDQYFSYEGGTLIFTQAGLDQSYISGSFAFGAHELTTERQINVEGTFENIPFSHVNGP